MSGNLIGGHYRAGTFNPTPEGPKAIAEAIRAMPSLTSINLYDNHLGAEGAKALAPAIRDSASLTTANLEYNDLGIMAVLRLCKVAFLRNVQARVWFELRL